MTDILELIDTYAETRHRCGGRYNSRTEAARKAVLEALSEVQALSAAPAVHASVKGAMWFTKKPVTIQAIQWTGDNLREVITFTDGPPDTRSHHAGMAWDAYRDLVARDGLKIYTLEGKMLASPGDWIIRGVKGELYPCKPDIFQETYAAASPTPPTEQQAQPVGQCVICGSDEPFTGTCGSGDPRALCKQAAPKAAPVAQTAPAPGERCQHCIDRRDGVYGSWAAPCPYHDDDGKPRPTAKAAPQQEAQEPALFASAKQLADLADPSHATGGSYLPARKTRAGLFTQPLYTAPQPAHPRA